MSMRELGRLKVIQAVADGHLRWRAAELTSRKHGRSSNRQLPPGLESRVRGLIRDSYADSGPTLAAAVKLANEKLA